MQSFDEINYRTTIFKIKKEPRFAGLKKILMKNDTHTALRQNHFLIILVIILIVLLLFYPINFLPVLKQVPLNKATCSLSWLITNIK